MVPRALGRAKAGPMRNSSTGMLKLDLQSWIGLLKKLRLPAHCDAEQNLFPCGMTCLSLSCERGHDLREHKKLLGSVNVAPLGLPEALRLSGLGGSFPEPKCS